MLFHERMVGEVSNLACHRCLHINILPMRFSLTLLIDPDRFYLIVLFIITLIINSKNINNNFFLTGVSMTGVLHDVGVDIKVGSCGNYVVIVVMVVQC